MACRHGGAPEPTAAIIAAQSTRSTEQGDHTGFDASKKASAHAASWHTTTDRAGPRSQVWLPEARIPVSSTPSQPVYTTSVSSSVNGNARSVAIDTCAAPVRYGLRPRVNGRAAPLISSRVGPQPLTPSR